MGVLAVPLALVAAALFATATVLQQKGAMQEPESEALKPTFLVRLLRKPVWLLGVSADVGGYATQAAALGVGRLVVVQPLLVASVVFALPLGVRVTGQRIGRREVLGAAAVCIGLGAFRFFITPSGGQDDATAHDWIAGALIVGATAFALTLAALGRSPARRAALLGTAAGVVLGFGAALTKATVDRFGDGLVAIFWDWHVYALFAVGLTGFLLIQASLQTGVLAPALTTETVFETLGGLTVGVAVLHEGIDEQPWEIALSLLALGAIVGGLIALARSRGAAEPRRTRLEAAPV